MRFSASRAGVGMQCMLQYRFKYVDGLPDPTNAKTCFGSVMHLVLERYERGSNNLELALSLWSDWWREPEKVGLEHGRWPKFTNWSGLNDRGRQILETYHEQRRLQPVDIVALEHRFLVPFGEHELTGVVDKLDIKKSGNGRQLLRLVDYKTASRKPTVAELALNIQFSIYHYALSRPEFWLGNGPEYPAVDNGEWWFSMLEDQPRRCVWHHLWTGQELDAGGRDQEDYERLYRLLSELDKAIKHEVYVPSISADHCNLCSYANGPCPARVPTAEDLAAQPAAWI